MGKKVVIIGAVALGPKVACRVRRLDPEAEITLIDRDSIISYGGCGIPYFVGGDVAEAKELLSTVYHVQRDADFFKVYKSLTCLTRTEAISIDRRAKTVLVRNLDTNEEQTLEYDKLVLGTGSTPFMPPLEGKDLPGVHVVANIHHAQAIKDAIAKGKVGSAVIVGGGAIGLEMAEALTDLWGIETTVVEMLPSILPQALGTEMAKVVATEMERNDVKIITGDCVTKILGSEENGVTGVETRDAGTIDCDMVIFGVGARPNSQIAADAGLATGRFGGIMVNSRLQTTDPDIYAGGDCVELINALTGENAYMPLGSLANREGRVIGTNIVGGNAQFKGVVGTFCLKTFNVCAATAGLTVQQAKNAGFDPTYAIVVMADRAHFYPTQKSMYMKMIADKNTRQVLGVEAVGENGDAVKSRVDAVAALLPHKVSVDEISNLEVGYAPPLASAMDIVNAAANALDNVLSGLNNPVAPEEFIKRFKEEGQGTVLDVRAPDNAEAYVAKYGDRWINIPQEQLGDRIDEVKAANPTYVFCNTGLRSYECQVFLASKGLKDIKNVQGGHGFLRDVDTEFTKREE